MKIQSTSVSGQRKPRAKSFENARPTMPPELSNATPEDKFLSRPKEMIAGAVLGGLSVGATTYAAGGVTTHGSKLPFLNRRRLEASEEASASAGPGSTTVFSP